MDFRESIGILQASVKVFLGGYAGWVGSLGGLERLKRGCRSRFSGLQRPLSDAEAGDRISGRRRAGRTGRIGPEQAQLLRPGSRGGRWREGMGWSVGEVEFLLRGWTGWGDAGRFGGQADAGEVGTDGIGVGQDSDLWQAGAAVGTQKGVRQENSGEKLRPGHRGRAGWSRMGAGLGVARWRVAGAGYDEGAVGGMRRQDALVADQVQARRWRQGDQAADELQGLEHQVCGAVVPWGLQGEGQVAVVQLLEAAVGQRRTVDVAAEAFQAVVVVGVDGGGGVPGEAASFRRLTWKPPTSAVIRRL